MCQTNLQGACLVPASGPLINTTIDAGATPTFAVFVRSMPLVAFDPAYNRVFLAFFFSQNGLVRGSTSVAFRGGGGRRRNYCRHHAKQLHVCRSEQKRRPVSAQVTSSPLTISGLDAAAAISITGGTYSIGCGATFTSAAGTISNNQTVCVRHTTAATSGAAISTVLTIGGVADSFTSTTADDTTPNNFTFVDQNNVSVSAVITSSPVTISGISTAAITITGGTYSIGCGATFTSAPGTISNNQTVCVRHTSAAAAGTTTDTRSRSAE